MRVSQVKELFRQLVKMYFAEATVAFTRQSRAAKSGTPLVTITPGNVNRPTHPAYKDIDGYAVGSYLSRISMTLDLFTNGAPVIEDETGQTVAYENTAMDDMLSFVDFLDSQYVIEWCHRNDVSILVDGDVQDLTGIVNDNNYEFRSRLNVLFYFTQRAVGYAGVLSEESILYPADESGATIEPVFEVSSSGGGTQELADSETGYFTEVEIKEDTGNE